MDVELQKLAKIIANIIINDLMKHANDKGCHVNELGMGPYDIYWLATLIELDVLDRSKVSTIIDHFMEHGGELKAIVSQLDLWPRYDTGKLEQLIDEVIQDSPKVVEDVRGGKKKAMGHLMGQLKRKDPTIDSREAMEMLNEKLLGPNN